MPDKVKCMDSVNITFTNALYLQLTHTRIKMINHEIEVLTLTEQLRTQHSRLQKLKEKITELMNAHDTAYCKMSYVFDRFQ